MVLQPRHKTTTARVQPGYKQLLQPGYSYLQTRTYYDTTWTVYTYRYKIYLKPTSFQGAPELVAVSATCRCFMMKASASCCLGPPVALAIRSPCLSETLAMPSDGLAEKRQLFKSRSSHGSKCKPYSSSRRVRNHLHARAWEHLGRVRVQIKGI